LRAEFWVTKTSIVLCICVSHREGILSDLLRETEDVEAKRKACLETREILRRAVDILNEVRSMSLPTNAAARASLSANGAHRGTSNDLELDMEDESKFVSRRSKR
jgi:hypothetical protein